MSKHTPGPWCVRHDDMVCSQEGRIIADCESTPYAMRPAPPIVEDKANATLIAAAPELLAALKAASEWLNDMGCEHEEPDLTCVVCLVNAAINKAEGREG